MIVKISQESHIRKSLLNIEVVHKLIEIALTSCSEENSQLVLEERGYAKDSIVTLYNLYFLDKSKFYIPCETIKQLKNRTSFMFWIDFYQ